MNHGDRVTRRQTKDRCLFIVISGSFFSLGEGYPRMSETYKTGAIIGVDQFMKDDYWDMDLICKEEGSIMGKFEFQTFQSIKDSQPATAIKIYNRIVRLMSFEMIYRKKNDPEVFTDRMMEIYSDLRLKDEDLLIDLRLGQPKEITNLFMANQANINVKYALEHQKKQEELAASSKPGFATKKDPGMVIGAKKDVLGDIQNSHLPNHGLHSVDGAHFKGVEEIPFGVKNKIDLVESLPLFLSDHYKNIYLESAQNASKYGSTATESKGAKNEEKKEIKKGPTKMYKSSWVLDKINQQNDKRKKMRGQQAPKPETAAPSSAPSGQAQGKKGKGKGASTVDTFELEQIIEELQFDLRSRDQEFKELRDELEKTKSNY